MAEEEVSTMQRVEARRLERGLTQAEVARACGLTQGHYSKLAQGMHGPGRRVGIALEERLESRPKRPSDQLQAMRIAALAASIREDCAALIRLTRRGGTARGGGVRKSSTRDTGPRKAAD